MVRLRENPNGVAVTIEELRRRFPCEQEIDRILTRKMLRRDGPGYNAVSLETLVDGLHALLKSELINDYSIARARWLTGGSSKVQMAFDLTWKQDEGQDVTTPMVVRMEPSEAIVETSRVREIQLINAVHGVVPVPLAYWVDADGSFFPYPAIVYGFIQGVAKPSKAVAGVAGIGTHFPREIRETLAQQFIEHMAAIHLLDWSKQDLSAFDKPALGTEAVELQINWWERVWEEDFREDEPIIRLAAAWLRQNMPAADRISIIHGDYRPGNFLYTEHDNQISGWLDWELGHLGDRHKDIAWSMAGYYGHPDEVTGEFLIGGLIPETRYFAMYEAASGLSVDPDKVHYYRVLNMFELAVISNATSYRVSSSGKTHQDILVAWITGLNGIVLNEVATLIEAKI